MDLDDDNVCKLLDLSPEDLYQTRKNFVAKENYKKSQTKSKPNFKNLYKF